MNIGVYPIKKSDSDFDLIFVKIANLETGEIALTSCGLKSKNRTIRKLIKKLLHIK